MKQHSANLQQAFASNPTRFVAAGAGSAPLKLFEGRLATRRPADSPTPALADKLRELNLFGMARAISQFSLDGDDISFEQHLSWLVEEEIADRLKRRLAQRLRRANLRYRASIAEVDYSAVRGFDDALFHQLAVGQWIADGENAVIEGPTGVGKTWLACALGDKACHDGRSVRYESVPRLTADLVALHGSKRHAYRMRQLMSVDLLILDDWGLERFTAAQRVEIFEILDRRYDRGSVMIVSQHPIAKWPRVIGGPATSALLIDRIIHNARRLELKGASLRDRARAC